MENSIEKIGVCPICKKGQMVKGNLGYSCNYFKAIDDKCSFNIYHTYWEKEITKEIATELITTGKTSVFNDLQKKEGGYFSAALKIDVENKKVVPVFANKIIDNCKCPQCEHDVEELLTGYACVNYHNENNKCGFFVPKKICEREIPEEAIRLLCKDKITPFLDGFIDRNQQLFSAKLSLTEDMSIKFLNDICKCPKCGGNIYIGRKAYNCQNYNTDIKCTFSVWREMNYRPISIEEVITLCKDKITPPLIFQGKEGEYSRKLSINEDFKIILIE